MNERQLEKLKKLYEEHTPKKGKTFGKLENGITKWRFIPYKNDEDGDPVHFFRYDQHHMGKLAGYINCPKSFGQECPVCDWRAQHLNSADEKKRAFAFNLYPSKKILVNALQLKEDEDGKVRTEKTPVTIPIPKTVHDYIFDAMLKMGQSDILDMDEGNVIGIQKTSLSPDPRHVQYTTMIDPTPRPIFKGEVRDQVLARALNFDNEILPATEEECAIALKAAWKDADFIADAIQKRMEWLEKKKSSKK